MEFGHHVLFIAHVYPSSPLPYCYRGLSVVLVSHPAHCRAIALLHTAQPVSSIVAKSLRGHKVMPWHSTRYAIASDMGYIECHSVRPVRPQENAMRCEQERMGKGRQPM